MEIKLFGTKLCPMCNTAIKRINEAIEGCKDKVKFNYYDMETVDGLTEGALNEVMKLPTIVLLEEGRLIQRWNGEVPEVNTLKERLHTQGFCKESKKEWK